MPPRIPPACSSSRWWRYPCRSMSWWRNSAAWVYRGGQGRVHCGAKPTRAGLWYAQHGLTVWFAFACDNHSGDLIAAVGWRVTGTPLTAGATNAAPSWPGTAGPGEQEAPRPRGCG